MVIGLILLMTLPRLTALNQYLIVDEADRWRWAKDFVSALSQGDLAGTLVGDGYPGIVPVWAETVWIFIEAVRRSLVEGQWIGQTGLHHLFHEWDRTVFLTQQRLPIVLLNTIIALLIVWTVWRLFGKRVALISGLLIALDPFYLSDSRVNRAEALITGLMTLSILSLIFYYRQRHFRYVIMSGFLGGLSFLTKIQALVVLPVIALAGLLIYADDLRGKSLWPPAKESLGRVVWFGVGWLMVACLTWLILWPSMWVTPIETLTLVYNYATHKVGAEGINVFFLGQTYRDADPGLLFYPVVFFLRITPLVLLGLIGAVIAGFRRWQQFFSKERGQQVGTLADDPFAAKGTVILVVYVLVYALIMTVGSHKQDRYLMPVFLSLDILAAMGLVYLWIWLKSKKDHPFTPYSLLPTSYFEWILFAGLVIIQIATVLPHHPYYYSYFNPLFGGGQTAVRTMRIGWGEGMDQVGAYLAAKPNSQNLVVSSRFTHNMLGFKGELISLGPNGRWTQADYIVLYIQQAQRGLDPSPGFIDYFQARQPEKVITLAGIDYAWIYPIPFTTPANPQISVIPHQAALLGYSWETNQPTNQLTNQPTNQLINQPTNNHSPIRLLWENLGLADDRQLVARLTGAVAETEWAACLPDPAFTTQAQTPGAYVESLCVPVVTDLSPGIYTVEFGLARYASEEKTEAEVEPLLFPQGWQAARVTIDGEVVDTSKIERLEAIVQEAVPAEAQRLDRVYDGRIRLAAYQLDPAQPKPGATLELTLYWQVVEEVREPVHLITQLADSRSISLGRLDSMLPPFAASPVESERVWSLGEVIVTHHQFELASDLEGPLAARVEVSLLNEAEVFLQPTNLVGEKLDIVVAHFTVAPDTWSTLANAIPVEANWQNGLTLQGYAISSEQPQPGESLLVSLFWQTNQPLVENYVVFVHLLDETGQLRTQNDSLPRAGTYPTPWWQLGRVVEDVHPLILPEDLPPGIYQLVVGLYRQEDGLRLPLIEGEDNFMLQTVEVKF